MYIIVLRKKRWKLHVNRIQMKRLSFILIGLLLLPTVHSGVISTFSAQTTIKNEQLTQDTITITLEAPSFFMKENEEKKTTIEIDGYGTLLTPGYPRLPSKVFTIAVPRNEKICSIKPISIISQRIPGNFDLIDVGVFYPLGTPIQKQQVITAPEIPAQYPSSSWSIEGKGSFGNCDYIQIRFTPFTYDSIQKTLIFHKQITLELSYTPIKKDDTIKYGNTQFNTYATSLIKNYDIFKSDDHRGYQPVTSDQYDYVIITTENLAPSIQFLKYWREITGYSPKVVTLPWIIDSYDGVDTQQQIRNFLIDKYDQWGIRYVLIVGGKSSIPMRYCYPDKDNHAYSGKTPTDFYYADLTGDWDADNDGFYGEKSQDEPDFLAELAVGRIPINTPALVEQICQKIIAFEQTDEPWKKQALLIGALLTLENEDHSNYDKTDGAYLMESISSSVLSPNQFQPTTLYEKEGLSPSGFQCDFPLSLTNVTNEFSKGYGLVNWNAHGLSTATYRLYWEEDDGDGVPESRETASPYFISTSQLAQFNDDKPAIVFSCSCENAHPEWKNIGSELLKQGAVSFIGASRNAWGTVGWSSVKDGGCTSLDYLFMDHLINNEKNVGSALYDAKYDFFTEYDTWGWTNYQNLYAFNLYGDPASSFKTITTFLPPSNPSSPQGPQRGVILSNVTFSTDATDSDGHQLFYQWDNGDGYSSAWLGPYESGESAEVDLKWNKAGIYNVSVRVRDSTGMESEWSDPVTIEIDSPEIQIKRFGSGIGSFRVVLENIGDAEALNVSWTIRLQEGIHLNSERNGVIDSIKPGKRAVVRNPFLFGFGLPIVTIEVESEKCGYQKESTTALLLGPLIVI